MAKNISPDTSSASLFIILKSYRQFFLIVYTCSSVNKPYPFLVRRYRPIYQISNVAGDNEVLDLYPLLCPASYKQHNRKGHLKTFPHYWLPGSETKRGAISRQNAGLSQNYPPHLGYTQ